MRDSTDNKEDANTVMPCRRWLNLPLAITGGSNGLKKLRRDNARIIRRVRCREMFFRLFGLNK
ncbi:hypothetical protein ACFSDI_11225 [Evansella tamaricis]